MIAYIWWFECKWLYTYLMIWMYLIVHNKCWTVVIFVFNIQGRHKVYKHKVDTRYKYKQKVYKHKVDTSIKVQSKVDNRYKDKPRLSQTLIKYQSDRKDHKIWVRVGTNTICRRLRSRDSVYKYKDNGTTPSDSPWTWTSMKGLSMPCSATEFTTKVES